MRPNETPAKLLLLPLLFFALAALAALAPTALAQAGGTPPAGEGTQSAPPAALKEGVRAAVQVTAMDLDVVAEKDGKAVTDLSRDEFRITVGGRPAAVDYFTRVEAGNLHGPDLATASPDLILETFRTDDGTRYLPRQFLAFFDDEHLLPPDRDRLAEGLRDLVMRLSPSDQVAIWSYNVTPHVLVPFTSSKEDLLAGLAKLLSLAPRGLTWQSQFQTTVQQVRRTYPRQREPLIRSWAEQIRVRERSTMQELRRAISALSARNGRRVLLYLSRGLELRPGQTLVQALGPQPLQQFDYSVVDEYRAVVAEANRSGVTIDAFDARGLMVDADASEREPSAFDMFWYTQNLREALAGFADETGGILVADRNFYKAALEKVYREASTYYSLGLTVGAADSKGKVLAVRVTTTRPGVTVRARTTWASKPAEDAAKDRVEMALVTPDARGDFPIRVEAGAPKKGGGLGKRLVPFTVLIPAAGLTFEKTAAGRRASVEVLLGAVEDDGSKSPVAAVKVPIEIPEEKWVSAQREPFSWKGELQSRKGNIRFVAGVRDLLSGRIGLASTSLRVE